MSRLRNRAAGPKVQWLMIMLILPGMLASMLPSRFGGLGLPACESLPELKLHDAATRCGDIVNADSASTVQIGAEAMAVAFIHTGFIGHLLSQKPGRVKLHVGRFSHVGASPVSVPRARSDLSSPGDASAA